MDMAILKPIILVVVLAIFVNPLLSFLIPNKLPGGIQFLIRLIVNMALVGIALTVF